MSELRTYPSEAAALRRVVLLRQSGVWPGVVRCGDRWRLTADPDVPRTHRESPGEEAGEG
jgi:hypothetical protein